MMMFKRLYWRLYIVWLSLRWIFALNLGDEVRWRDRNVKTRWILVQGVRDPIWTLSHVGDGHRVEADKKIFRKVWSIHNCIGSFHSGHQFYMRNWYWIWLNEGFKPWMSACIRPAKRK